MGANVAHFCSPPSSLWTTDSLLRARLAQGTVAVALILGVQNSKTNTVEHVRVAKSLCIYVAII